ncbi:hypothetical protein NA8A_23419 [Nitratireductor indicus C115]|uniref:Uncharacterized protein n=1 Tax=Nitratireductor indicus C115 TaxID=1231190 RepID=K2NPZ6_9HYPH|nr:hypothetical protein [Nitratireductor indicus]EKF39934.1 hypothetical protein NA8A_23419 [Nitratireductor indicus C115]SFQ82057.1 hypothetical protein SAMN05216176_12710 [Nitratireductor indicus]
MDIKEVRRIHLARGDRLIVRIKGRISDEVAKRIKEQFEGWAGPGNPVLVIDESVDLEVLSVSA